MRFVDLSTTLENDRSWAPWWMSSRVKYQNHRFGRRAIRLLFGLSRKHLKTGLGWANETIRLSTHGTTHVDAPWHFSPECAGVRAKSIDEIPLSYFYGPGVVLDIRHVHPEAAAHVADIQRALQDVCHQLKPGDIVLVKTSNDRLLGTPAYFDTGPGVSAQATRWLIDQGVKLMGIDSWGWDRPLRLQAKEAKQTGRANVFWEAHYVGADVEYLHMERLANLDELPPHGFTVCAFPLKIKNASAGPARVVALFDE